MSNDPQHPQKVQVQKAKGRKADGRKADGRKVNGLSVASPEFRLLIVAVALTPFTGTLDYGLGTGHGFRMLPPILLWIATAWVFCHRPWEKLSRVDLAVVGFIACSVLSGFYAVWILDQAVIAQVVGLAVVAGHAVFFGLGRRVGELRVVLRVFVVAMLVAGILGLLQRFLLEVGICKAASQIPATLENRCLVGGALSYAPELGRIRLPGTASSPWHWSWLLVAGATCAPALFSDRQRRWRLLGAMTLLVLVACSFLSGQRLALVLVPLVGLAASLAALPIRGRRLAIAGAGLSIFGLLALTLPPVRAALTDLGGRWRASPPAEFVFDQWRWAVRERPGLIGHGPGAATSAARHFDRRVMIESVPAKRLFEGGWLGLGSWYLTVGLIGLGLWRRRATVSGAARAISVYVLVLAVNPWWYPTDTDPGNLLFWLFAGLLLHEPEV